MTFFILVPDNESMYSYLTRSHSDDVFYLNTSDAARHIDEHNPQRLYRVEIRDAGLSNKELMTLRKAALRDDL